MRRFSVGVEVVDGCSGLKIGYNFVPTGKLFLHGFRNARPVVRIWEANSLHCASRGRADLAAVDSYSLTWLRTVGGLNVEELEANSW